MSEIPYPIKRSRNTDESETASSSIEILFNAEDARYMTKLKREKALEKFKIDVLNGIRDRSMAGFDTYIMNPERQPWTLSKNREEIRKIMSPIVDHFRELGFTVTPDDFFYKISW